MKQRDYKKVPLLLVYLLMTLAVAAQKITGRITGELGQPLPFASVTIKGTTTGVVANAEGVFSIEVQPGKYTLACQHIGYFSSEVEVSVGNADVNININLPLQQYNLSGVTVHSGGENPAYAIIRKAIQKRPEYEHEIKALQCDVYIKGRLQLRSHPQRFLGQKVDLPDTAQNQTLFLSETVARYSKSEPDKEKVEVISTRVSGNSSGYGLSFPQIISFYNNNIQIGENLNPRGFVSPIGDNALDFYDYKLNGTFYDNGLMINHIRVIPKHAYEPTFNGYINIIEDSWRIYSVQLTILKEQQMQLLDTLKIDQQYIPVGNTWMVKQQVIYPSMNLFGFSGYGDFVQVYSNYNLNPHFDKNFFNNVIIKYPDSSNKKPAPYWDTIRPVPLNAIEKEDYRKKDSLEILRQSPHYIDSVDRKKNKPKVIPLILTGQTFIHTREKLTYTFDPLINVLNYNTVEGADIIFSPDITKRWGTGRRSLFISPTLRYGFSNEHFNAHLTGNYNWGKRYANSFYFSGGRRVFQFNNNQPITSFSNTLGSLLFRRNYMKIYEAAFGKLAFTKGIGNGFTVGISGEFQDRYPLQNTTDYHMFNLAKERVHFTPNYPFEISNSNILHHQAAIASVNISWQPGAKYIELPSGKINIGSDYPAFGASLTQGIHGLAGSDVNYTKWTGNVTDDVDLKLAGTFSYRVMAGGFLNRKSVFLPDYQYYYANRGVAATEYLNSFQLMPYYAFGNTNKFYTEAHVEYHLNGLLTNKIPLMRRWNWFFVVGGNALYLKDKQYYEYFLAIDNILKIFRINFIQTYEPQGHNTSGITFSAAGLLTSKKED
ncbi:carboxypeptidase-like regulatory domain-containing protein [Ilyomonas limi]|uniref:Carboxypeptidase-like regulatory domain-containing protein n=1 Tax=Ilyomonas limi TaxID=2575867 RepID=A0A4U3L668_9BACT|nr:DUF5686 and carboxypeptidase regulatory-like domain-containing protein [Ilyomonas limi]TKK69864.1 carboxypeptidase-like regulatory domain-containing protein [Ilyomonas limi]